MEKVFLFLLIVIYLLFIDFTEVAKGVPCSSSAINFTNNSCLFRLINIKDWQTDNQYDDDEDADETVNRGGDWMILPPTPRFPVPTPSMTNSTASQSPKGLLPTGWLNVRETGAIH